MHPEEQRKCVTSYVKQRYYISSARATFALYTFNLLASYLIASCSLQSMWYGRIRASLIDGNNAYGNKRRDRVYIVCMPYFTVLSSSIVIVRTFSNYYIAIPPSSIIDSPHQYTSISSFGKSLSNPPASHNCWPPPRLLHSTIISPGDCCICLLRIGTCMRVSTPLHQSVLFTFTIGWDIY